MVETLRTAASKVAEVGQIRRRRGTSMKRMTKAEALRRTSELVSTMVWEGEEGGGNEQGEGAEDDDDDVKGEDVGYS